MRHTRFTFNLVYVSEPVVDYLSIFAAAGPGWSEEYIHIVSISLKNSQSTYGIQIMPSFQHPALPNAPPASQ